MTRFVAILSRVEKDVALIAELIELLISLLSSLDIKKETPC